jgi:hypothetical protein
MEQEIQKFEFKCACAIVTSMMRSGKITTVEHDLIVQKLKQKYGIEEEHTA